MGIVFKRKERNAIEIKNSGIIINGARIDPSLLEITLEPKNKIKIKLEIEGFIQYTDIGLDYH